ncbi:hypothetical protein EDC04DRAFT_644299 [Pisolithus marmoratus]|nr:hypothetical protein EDC04DRAFT_644299 [Pisolithus marmoratus]
MIPAALARGHLNPIIHLTLVHDVDKHSPSCSADIQPIPRHTEYYLDGNTTFLVEGQLFRVHRYFFERESEFFRNYLIPSDECDGTDEKPYSLDVTSEDFAKLLWVWYNPSYHREDQPRDTWLTILTLARRWGFESIIELAIYQLEQLEMGATERIAIYTEHEIDKRLLIPSYIELCRSPTLPSLAEAAWLPMEILLGLTVSRERALCRAAELGSCSPTSAVLEDEDLVAIIVDVFGIEGVADQPGPSGTDGTNSPHSTHLTSNDDPQTLHEQGLQGQGQGEEQVALPLLEALLPLVLRPNTLMSYGDLGLVTLTFFCCILAYPL